MFSLLEIFRIRVFQLLFPQIRRWLETLRSFSSENDYKKTVQGEQLWTCKAERLYRDGVLSTCVRSYPCFKLVPLFEHYALSCVILVIHYGSLFFFSSPPTRPGYPRTCVCLISKGHTSSKSSSRLCMTISEDEMQPTGARKCCDYALTRSSKTWCLAAQ